MKKLLALIPALVGVNASANFVDPAIIQAALDAINGQSAQIYIGENQFGEETSVLVTEDGQTITLLGG